MRSVHDCAHVGSPWASSWAEAREAESKARSVVVSMAVENMAAANEGVSSATEAESYSDGCDEDGTVDVYSKSEVVV